ncbi:MAG: MarR family transcriptional regulator [Methanotrichaceae archaeon]|nr:MarR family transcriptional regulator [Methanotrichaceae archaeon]
MVNILQSKRESSRFQILVEIAAHQPNLRQKEVAERLGVTPQAISEYIKELAADGLVTTDGRMRYNITKEGVEWLLESAAELKRYARVVMEEIICHVSVWTALADEDLAEGERVSLEMREGLLFANRKKNIEATGVTISDAYRGEDVGVSDLRGLINLEEGRITVCKVPRIQLGGSRKADLESLKNLFDENKMVCCLGIEALVALRKLGKDPDVMFGAKESSIEAAYHGISSIIVSVDEQVPNILNRLESGGLKYELVDLSLI